MSFIREWAGTKVIYAYPDGIPDAKAQVQKWTLLECSGFLANQSVWHRVLVGLDMTLGQFGATDQDATISSRTALQCMNPQTAGTWALVLGALLEALDKGHLLQAMQADYARARLELAK